MARKKRGQDVLFINIRLGTYHVQTIPYGVVLRAVLSLRETSTNVLPNRGRGLLTGEILVSGKASPEATAEAHSRAPHKGVRVQHRRGREDPRQQAVSGDRAGDVVLYMPCEKELLLPVKVCEPDTHTRPHGGRGLSVEGVEDLRPGLESHG